MQTFALRYFRAILTETSMHRHVDMYRVYIDIWAGAGRGAVGLDDGSLYMHGRSGCRSPIET